MERIDQQMEFWLSLHALPVNGGKDIAVEGFHCCDAQKVCVFAVRKLFGFCDQYLPSVCNLYELFSGRCQRLHAMVVYAAWILKKLDIRFLLSLIIRLELVE